MIDELVVVCNCCSGGYFEEILVLEEKGLDTFLTAYCVVFTSRINGLVGLCTWVVVQMSDIHGLCVVINTVRLFMCVNLLAKDC